MVFIRKGYIQLGLSGLTGLTSFLTYKFGFKLTASSTFISLTSLYLFFRTFSGKKYTKILPINYKKVYKFTLTSKVYMLYCNIIQGYNLTNLIHFFLQYWRYIDFKIYGHRLLALFSLASFNTFLGFFESLFYSRALKKIKLPFHAPNVNDEKYGKDISPIFILGHPRSGTTLLHNLIAENKRHFIYPTTFFCGFPVACLILNSYKFIFAGALDKTRPMDNMPLSFDLPQEDELALNILSGGASPYSPLILPECEPLFRNYFTFQQGTESDEPSDPKIVESDWILEYKFKEWKRGLIHFLKKIYYCFDPEMSKRIVLKSPVHTARVKIFLDLFPNAKFIYIHREPYRVFQSACNMAEKTYVHATLTKIDDHKMQDFIIQQYNILFKEYVGQKHLIPEGNLIEVSYEEVTKDLVGVFKNIHDKFGIDNFEEMKPVYEDHVEKGKTFKKNDLSEMDDGMKEVVYEEWQKAFEYFGYNK